MKKVGILFKLGVFLFISLIVIIIGLYTYAYFSPKISIKSANQMYIYDSNEELVFQGSGTSKWIELDDISPYLINAVISVEDKYFYQHQGFDIPRIVKALYLNAKNREIVQGASTISQQYIKYMYLTFDQTWQRKIEEALLTLNLEVHYDKDDILEGYLNTINFGQGNYGIENASNYYFNKSASELNLEESIILAGIPKRPTRFNPVFDYDEAIKRAKIVANAMLNNEKITQEEYDSLFIEKLDIYGQKNSNNLNTLMYYQDAVLKELESLPQIPNSLLETGSIKVYTNLNLESQTVLENAINSNINDDESQVASIVVNPKNGAIEALSGGIDYAKSQFNRATNAKRQVGSAIKTLLYYAALENGFTSSSTFTSEPTTFAFSNNKTYSPSNYNDIYANDQITMAAAIAYSDNIYAVKTHLFLGQETLVNTAHKMGIKAKIEPHASLALGSSELSVIDFATAYATLASGGYYNELYFISKVEDMQGNTIYEKQNNKNLVLNPNYVYILNELLTTTYNSSFISYSTPTAITLASKISRKYSIKSGSTGTDFWIAGYNPDKLSIVWHGKDDSSTMNPRQSNVSKNIWVDTMEGILKDKEDSWYEIPDNIIGLPLNPISGTPNSNEKNTLFYYVKGTELTN